jgi:hypothetical protein
MDLRDYNSDLEISDVYGPLNGNELRYAADSPVELAPNLKGLSITLLHGANDLYVSYQQSRKMNQVLNGLSYAHVWEEIPGLDHNISTYEITRVFQRFNIAFDAPYSLPTVWRYRLAADTNRQVYNTIFTKTNPLTWTEIISVTTTGFESLSGDPFSLTTAPLYAPQSTYTVTITNLLDGSSVVTQVIATNGEGRLTLNLLAGRYRVIIYPAELDNVAYLPIIFKQG